MIIKHSPAFWNKIGTLIKPLTNALNVAIGRTTSTAKLSVQSDGTNDILNLFETGGTEVMTVLESGNVGIGLTTPSQKLEVRGAGLFSSASSTVAIGSYLDNLSGVFPTITSNIHGDFVFGLNLKILTDHTLSTTNNHASITGGAIVIGGNGYTNGANSINFFAQTPGAASSTVVVSPSQAALVIKGGGNVGIGTTAPNSKLQVNGSLSLPYVAKTANYTLTANDYLVDCTANSFTITLPTAVGISGRIYNIKNTGTGIITVDANSTQTIDGELTQTVNQWANLKIMSNNVNWIII